MRPGANRAGQTTVVLTGPRLLVLPDHFEVRCNKCPHRVGNYNRDRAIKLRGNITIDEFVVAVSVDCFHRNHPANLGPCTAAVWRPE